MPAKFEVVVRPEDVWNRGMRRHAARIRYTVKQVYESRKEEVEAWMKANAPWEDRTGDARASLHVELEEYLAQYVMNLMYGDAIYYDVYLEFDHGGKFSIVPTTMDYWAPELMHDVAQRLRYD